MSPTALRKYGIIKVNVTGGKRSGEAVGKPGLAQPQPQKLTPEHGKSGVKFAHCSCHTQIGPSKFAHDPSLMSLDLLIYG